MSNNKIQYMYIRDSKCPDRVMTVATQMLEQPGAIKVAFAVNRVAVEKSVNVTERGSKLTSTFVEVFDPYCKKHGKMIVEARLNKDNVDGKNNKNYIFVNPSNDIPMKVYVLEQLSNNRSLQPHVRNLAKQKLAEMETKKKSKLYLNCIA